MSLARPTPFDDVGRFHEKFNLPFTHDHRGAVLLDEATFQYRLKFLREELEELEMAHVDGNLTEFADALADLVWVAYGTAHFAGIPLDAVWAHVRRANLAKVLKRETDAEHKRDGAYKETIRKPDGWVGPSAGITDVLTRWNANADEMKDLESSR